MKNYFLLFVIILFFSCQNEKLYKERKAQKENDILNEKKLTDCKCTESEFELEQDFLFYLINEKGFDHDEALTYANCGSREFTAYGKKIILDPIEIISERIAVQYDKYGFNPYDDEISVEQKQTLANDSTFDPIFPYEIKDFEFRPSYSAFTSNKFTYEMFIGFDNDDPNVADGMPVRILQPDGYPEPLTLDEITEYHALISDIVITKFFVEGEHYKIICPSRIKEENKLLYGGMPEDVPKPCKKNTKLNVNVSIDDGLVDSDSDGIYDIEENSYETDPNNPDTDGDGISDLYELYLWGTDPLDFQDVPTDDEIYFFENCEEKQ